MNQFDAASFLPLIKAWSEGKTLQVKHGDNDWKSINFAAFTEPRHCYRIKPTEATSKTMEYIEARYNEVCTHPH